MKIILSTMFLLLSFNAAAFKQIDYTCQSRCMQQGMNFNYCTSVCSY